jgi:molybdenum cofactor synthesis domain-containing protein
LAILAGVDAAVVVVGDEILAGHVRDANTSFIAGRLAALGHRLRRVVVVPDDPGEISAALRREIDEPRDIVFTCGGLGPTHDDRTMEAVAEALGRPLVPCAPLAERIEVIAEHVKQQDFAGDPLGVATLQKMALAPEGAEALASSAWFIPAVVLREGDVTVVVLPGPPRELEIVFRDAVEPRFLEGSGTVLWREEIEHHFPESAIASTLTELEQDFPGVQIGSYPMEDRVLVRLAGPEEEVHLVAERVRTAVEDLAASDDGRKLLEYLNARRPKPAG